MIMMMKMITKSMIRTVKKMMTKTIKRTVMKMMTKTMTLHFVIVGRQPHCRQTAALHAAGCRAGRQR
jgi:hypothetical protein